MTNPTKWISKNFGNTEEGFFTMSGVSIEDIAAEVPTPFYVYDHQTIVDQYERLKHAVEPHGIGIYYSVKANTSLAVLQCLSRLGAGLEIASGGELLAVQSVGVNPQKVSFAGPVKSEQAIAEALDFGIHTLNVESMVEFERINRIAAEKGLVQTVGIRVNSKNEVAGAGGLMSGGSRKFGFDEEILDRDFFDKVKTLKSIRLSGIHVFAATQMLNTEAFLSNLDYVAGIAERLSTFFTVEYLDFGGGLGIPYSEDQHQLPLDQISVRIGETLKKYAFLQEHGTRLYIEPGRFLVGPCGVYVTRVDNAKTSRGKEMVLVDGGIHHLIRPMLVGSPHPMYNLSRVTAPIDTVVNVGGPLCTSLDFLGQDIPMAQPFEGNFIGVFNAGAYGWSEAMTYFLSHPTAAEVMVKDGTFYVVRESIDPGKFLETQKIFD